MVQTPFTWRYGGSQVFLSGSFNGWSERIPMLLMEGSESVYQKIIDLLPGCYQYKFLVDGTWHVDQQQICDVDEYGIVNNVVLVSGIEAVFQPSTSRGSSSSGSINGPIMQLLDGEMDVFRQVLSVHLFSSTTYELIPISGKVVALDVEMDVEQAFNVMYNSGLTVAPLWDENIGQITGMLTASDFILILLQLQRNLAMFANEELQVRTISSWKGWKLRHHRDIIGPMVPFQRRPLVHAGPDESLANVASRILHNNISAIPFIDSTNGSCSRLLHVACLAGVLKNICSYFKHHLGYLTLLQRPVGYLPIGSWAMEVRRTSNRTLLTLLPNATLSSALALLLEGERSFPFFFSGYFFVKIRICNLQNDSSCLLCFSTAQISSIPIVDNGGNFVNVYSRSDIISLARDNLYTGIQLNQITVSQALEFANERVQSRYNTCNRFDSLYRVMELLSEQDVRRVIVVEASSRRVEGIITLRDVFDFFFLR